MISCSDEHEVIVTERLANAAILTRLRAWWLVMRIDEYCGIKWHGASADCHQARTSMRHMPNININYEAKRKNGNGDKANV